MLDLNSDVRYIPKVGPAMAERLARLNVFTVSDLLYHLPVRYIDFSQITPISSLRPGQEVTLIGKILEIDSRRTYRRRLTIQTALVEDETGSIEVLWFNQPYLVRNLKPGTEVQLSGKAELDRFRLILKNPVYELSALSGTHTGRIVPFYPLTERISQRQIRFWIKAALDQVGQVPDDLPSEILEKENLCDLNTAFRVVHFPENLQEAEKAQKRVAFDELLKLELHAQTQRNKHERQKSFAIPYSQELMENFLKALPFELTQDQKKCAWDILQDIGRKHPMNRMLEGDVGSGKTVVAAAAILQTIKSGHQAAFLAPTEILAFQHYKTLSEILKKFKISIALLTGSKRIIGKKEKVPRKEIAKNITEGKIDLVIGTHAVIEEDIVFKNLALTIVDEQHRFGVNQRGKLLQRNKITPHLLSMTATPIPRSLALTVFGDLDLSVIKQKPKDRKIVKTWVIPPAKRKNAYEFINKEIDAGHQVFVVYPIIEESEKLRVKAATKEFERLSKSVFPDRKVGLLHGRLPKEEKTAVMEEFKRDKLDILVSTSVIEVGVDVPNATVMMIENAERFGLAQLHQFRGRVGRSAIQSYCLLFSDSGSPQTYSRLKNLEKYYDGIKLAEMDLKQRGPGQIYGTQQSGFLDFKAASLTDIELIEKARFWAKKIAQGGAKKYPILFEKLHEFEKKVHFE